MSKKRIGKDGDIEFMVRTLWEVVKISFLHGSNPKHY